MNRIVSFSKTHLQDTVPLIDTVFPYDEDRQLARTNLSETLQGKNFGQQYWVCLDECNTVQAMTGLYYDRRNKNDTDTVWLGWFGVHPACRRQGLGARLLRFSMNEARNRGCSCMKIYTSTDPHERAAHSLYTREGFSAALHSDKQGTVIFTLSLSPLAAEVKPPRFELNSEL